MTSNFGAYYGMAIAVILFSTLVYVATSSSTADASETIVMTYDFILTWGTNSSYKIVHTEWGEELDVDWYDKNGNKMKKVYPYKIGRGECKSKENCVWQDDQSQPAVSFEGGKPIQLELKLSRFHDYYLEGKKGKINTTKVVNVNDRISEFYQDNNWRFLYVFETDKLYADQVASHVQIYIPLEVSEKKK